MKSLKIQGNPAGIQKCVFADGRTVPKKGGVPQLRDTSKKQKTEDVKISAVGMEDEYGGRIIELVTDSEGDYELLK